MTEPASQTYQQTDVQSEHRFYLNLMQQLQALDEYWVGNRNQAHSLYQKLVGDEKTRDFDGFRFEIEVLRNKYQQRGQRYSTNIVWLSTFQDLFENEKKIRLLQWETLIQQLVVRATDMENSILKDTLNKILGKKEPLKSPTTLYGATIN